MKKIYLKNKSLKKGAICICPSCGSTFTKEHYQQVFCKLKGGTVCKDKYWNTVTPTKRKNMTRISPASRAWINSREREDDEYQHPYEGLNDESYKIR